jgi:hypothetical protein
MMAVFTPITKAALVTTGIARIERRVCLNQLLHQAAGPRTKTAPRRADDPRRDGVLEPEGITERHHQLARRQSRRVAEERGDQVAGAHAQHGEIGVRVVANQIGRQPPAIEQCHVDAFALGHDMTVGENQPVVREDEPRAAGAPADLDIHHRRRETSSCRGDGA